MGVRTSHFGDYAQPVKIFITKNQSLWYLHVWSDIFSFTVKTIFGFVFFIFTNVYTHIYYSLHTTVLFTFIVWGPKEKYHHYTYVITHFLSSSNKQFATLQGWFNWVTASREIIKLNSLSFNLVIFLSLVFSPDLVNLITIWSLMC